MFIEAGAFSRHRFGFCIEYILCIINNVRKFICALKNEKSKNSLVTLFKQ